MKIVIFPSEAIRIHSDLSQGCHGILRCLRGDASASMQESLNFLESAVSGLTSLLEDIEKASLEVFSAVHIPGSTLDLVPARSLGGFELPKGCHFRVGIDRLGSFARKYSLCAANEEGLLPKAIWLENDLEWLLPKVINPLAKPNQDYRVDQVNGTELFT